MWTSDSVINSNLSLAICIILLLPYLVIWKAVPGSAIKDFVATALTLHTLLAFIINFKVTLLYLLFACILGVIAGGLGTYGARLREQHKLIEEIRMIEGEDRKEHRMPV